MIEATTTLRSISPGVSATGANSASAGALAATDSEATRAYGRGYTRVLSPPGEGGAVLELWTCSSPPPPVRPDCRCTPANGADFLGLENLMEVIAV